MSAAAESFAEDMRQHFWDVLRQSEFATPLKQALQAERLGAWTTVLTAATVATFSGLGWRTTARRHASELLPVSRGEYLGLDVMAFADAPARWRFPLAAAELENRRELDYIAYALWKLLCVRVEWRWLFCYARETQAAPGLVQQLRQEVVGSLSLAERTALTGQTFVVVWVSGHWSDKTAYNQAMTRGAA